MFPLKVLLIEDDPMVREVHRQFIDRIEGFSIIGIASNGMEGLRLVKELSPDLAIIDIYMPYMGGLEMLSELRSEAYSVDVIAITAASDIETIARVRQQGAVDYIIKPFTFDRIKKSLDNYKNYRVKLGEKKALLQEELDQILFIDSKEESERESLPKGLNMNTLIKITDFISQEKEPISAEEVAESIGMARVTARRYLDYLEKEGKVKIHIHYGGVGRPINRYGV
ncbi:response regulator [Bacillus sp. ISL-40]|uniref:response regulator n=1 Tax=unclassified Bacillus (in: firmicutes) TaxID=185979 RepID=UPI001BEA292C|nr:MULTISPECIES: response regulator [unclassified Bacillus (in: firmicutes)]MBT2696233.1 response regulator [Bacillus sp. ISL-40]MBT2720389.1 response regulator [Bacillus sp. ISL-46]MBT2743082.1 response regulator [Bacillus sp. ISL-77]